MNLELFKYMNILMFVIAWLAESSADGVFDQDEIEKAVNAFALWFGYNFTPEEVAALFSIVAKIRGEEIRIKL